MDQPPRAGGPPPSSRSVPARIAPQYLPAPNRPASPGRGGTGTTGALPKPQAPQGTERRPTQADLDRSYATLLQAQGDTARTVFGFVLLAVPLIALVNAYLLPTIRTVQLSRIEGLSVLGSAETIGTANYDEVAAEGAFTAGLADLAGPIAMMVLAGAVLAPLAAWLIHRGGRRLRTTATVVWALAAVAFAPAALSVAWVIDRIVAGGDREAGLWDWPGLIAGVVLGLGVIAGLAALRGNATGKPALLVTACLAAFATAAAGLQTFAYSVVSGLPQDAETPVAQIFRGLYSGISPGLSSAKSVLLMAILAALGLGAALVFAAARTRIDVSPDPVDPTPTRSAAVVGIAALVLLLAAVGSFLLPWLARFGEDTREGADLWLAIRRTWGPPLITTAVALPVAAIGGYAVGALRPLGGASRWLLLAFAPWLFIGSGPLGAANLEAVAGEGEYMVIGSFPPRAWIAVPLLFVFTALFWGLEDRRRAALIDGAEPGEARLAFFKAAWPMTGLMGLALLLVNGQDLFWQQLTFQDMLSSGPMITALEHLEFEHSGVALGFPIPILIVALLAAAAAAVWYLPRLAIRVGKD
ncbi:hypothetical protein [Glycomyces algeriensis]|uniref:Uncharacterized protein n=1 Tax=Glycomyces algeriensis TaxID=256037 RepID=A0A9W6LHZ6_9ACTN|nr:hypothetical protein [Glycomyces algeriensis]MDA1368377.1 hypothetical protein [Glycomyces algeriensis]MDR7351820.1 hypothetical protein [Glycomyces algeriensis]GLI44547.1 hypothetical protein GALLR39Z86_43970 [Glycomyces algeriensis]